MDNQSILDEMKSLQKSYNNTQLKLDNLISKEKNNTEFSQIIDILRQELSKDKSEGSYYHSWQCNITMAFIDEWNSEEFQQSEQEERDFHKLANNAAKRFLDQLIKE